MTDALWKAKAAEKQARQRMLACLKAVKRSERELTAAQVVYCRRSEQVRRLTERAKEER